MWKNAQNIEQWSQAVGQKITDVQDLEALQVDMETTDPTETVENWGHETQGTGNGHHERNDNAQAWSQKVQSHLQNEEKRAKKFACQEYEHKGQKDLYQ